MDNQNTNLSSRSKSRSGGKRIWLMLTLAILLVTLPVLPLCIPGARLHLKEVRTEVDHLGSVMISKLNNLKDRFHQSRNDHESKPGESGQAVDQKAAGSALATSDMNIIDRTVKTLLRRISKEPQDPSLYNRLGLVYLELGEFHSAVTQFDQAVETARGKIAELTRSADRAKKAGDIARASDLIAEISALNVQLAAAHSSLARVYERMGRSDRVIAHLNELDRDITLAKAYKKTGKKKKRGHKSGATTGANRLQHKTANMLAKASALKQAGRNVEAIQEYRKLLKASPDLAIAHRELGNTAMLMKNYWLAEKELKKAVELDPKDATASGVLGNLYLTLGRVEDATGQFEQTVAIDPENSHAAFQLGNIYANTGRFDKARQAFEKAVASKPGSASAHNNLATMCSMAGDYSTAVSEFKRAIELSPNMASAHYGMGIALMHLRRYSESIPAFKAALALNPALVDAHNKLAIASKKKATAGHYRVN